MYLATKPLKMSIYIQCTKSQAHYKTNAFNNYSIYTFWLCIFNVNSGDLDKVCHLLSYVCVCVLHATKISVTGRGNYSWLFLLVLK